MKKHRISWPPQRELDRLGRSAAILHHDAPNAAATGPAARELLHVVTGSAS